MNSHKIIGIIVIILGLLLAIGGGAIMALNLWARSTSYNWENRMLEKDIPEEFLKKPAELTTDTFSSYGIAQILENQIKIGRLNTMQIDILLITDTIFGGLFVILGLVIICLGAIVIRTSV